MRSIRLWYKKSGLAIYTSHLDMNRCFTRAVRRAEIPLWYTEGFNPHPYMTFLMPLPLGQVGMREPLDIRVEDDNITNKEVRERMNAVLPEGLEIVDVTKPESKPNEIAAAEYEITVRFAAAAEAEGFASGADSVMKGGILNAEKRSKRGTKVVNLCEMVRSFSAEQIGENVRISAVLASGNTVNLNADLLVNALLNELSASADGMEIVRTMLLKDDLKIFE